jgi:hypothetical protein
MIYIKNQWWWPVLTVSPFFSLKVLPHTRHSWGRASLWLCRWARRLCAKLYTLSQCGHLKSWFPWLFMCNRNVLSFFNHFPQSLHCFCSLFATWVYKCCFSADCLGNVLGQMWHIASRTFSCTYRWWESKLLWLANLQIQIYTMNWKQHSLATNKLEISKIPGKAQRILAFSTI